MAGENGDHHVPATSNNKDKDDVDKAISFLGIIIHGERNAVVYVIEIKSADNIKGPHTVNVFEPIIVDVELIISAKT